MWMLPSLDIGIANLWFWEFCSLKRPSIFSNSAKMCFSCNNVHVHYVHIILETRRHVWRICGEALCASPVAWADPWSVEVSGAWNTSQRTWSEKAEVREIWEKLWDLHGNIWFSWPEFWTQGHDQHTLQHGSAISNSYNTCKSQGFQHTFLVRSSNWCLQTSSSMFGRC